jgi:hypothetical protein
MGSLICVDPVRNEHNLMTAAEMSTLECANEFMQIWIHRIMYSYCRESTSMNASGHHEFTPSTSFKFKRIHSGLQMLAPAAEVTVTVLTWTWSPGHDDQWLGRVTVTDWHRVRAGGNRDLTSSHGWKLRLQQLEIVTVTVAVTCQCRGAGSRVGGNHQVPSPNDS